MLFKIHNPRLIWWYMQSMQNKQNMQKMQDMLIMQKKKTEHADWFKQSTSGYVVPLAMFQTMVEGYYLQPFLIRSRLGQTLADG